MEYNYVPQTADIFLCDSPRLSAKIVKFLMQEKTIWIWLYKKLFHKPLNIVDYYHAGMILYETKLIEQQWKVQLDETDKLIGRDIVIYRYKNLSKEQNKLLKQRANEDLGKLYDIPQLIGKTLTWLTGIKFFVDFLGGLSKEEEICVTRVAHWYSGICNFGVKDHSEITTKIIDEYCQNNPQEWEIAYKNNGGN